MNLGLIFFSSLLGLSGVASANPTFTTFASVPGSQQVLYEDSKNGDESGIVTLWYSNTKTNIENFNWTMLDSNTYIAEFDLRFVMNPDLAKEADVYRNAAATYYKTSADKVFLKPIPLYDAKFTLAQALTRPSTLHTEDTIMPAPNAILTTYEAREHFVLSFTRKGWILFKDLYVKDQSPFGNVSGHFSFVDGDVTTQQPATLGLYTGNLRYCQVTPYGC